MKKTTRDTGGPARILAVLGEGRKTTGELAARQIVKERALHGMLARLRKAGQIVQDAKGKPWRLAGGSPPLEGEVDEGPPAKAQPRARAKKLTGNPWDTKPAIVRDLYELVDRCNRAIAILEGRA